MTEFMIQALLLSLAAMIFVLLPIRTARQPVSGQRREANVAAYQTRLAELQADFSAGEYSEQELQRLTVELQRRLLEETGGKAGHVSRISSRWSYLLFAILVPVLAFVVYQQTGADQDWQIAQTIQQAQKQLQAGVDNQAELKRLAQQIRQRLQADNTNKDYWILLARTEMELEDYASAAASFNQIVKLDPQDITAHAHYAQALYLATNRQLSQDVQAAIERALALDPRQPTVLGLLGIHYYQEGQWQLALDYWRRLLAGLPAGSDNAAVIADAIAELEANIGGQGNQSAPAELPAVKVQVTIAEGMEASPEAPVFVYARAIGGPKMPLAIARLTVTDLPAVVLLNDTMGMTPELKLSSFREVELIARVAKSGIANAASGDLQGRIARVSVEKNPGLLSLQIDQVLP